MKKSIKKTKVCKAEIITPAVADKLAEMEKEAEDAKLASEKSLASDRKELAELEALRDGLVKNGLRVESDLGLRIDALQKKLA